MARNVAILALGVVIGIVGGAAAQLHAEADPVEAAAAEAGVDSQDLRGAVNTLQVDPRVYLRSEGLLERAPPPPPSAAPTSSAPSGRVACIIRVESQGNPRAYNWRSGASGLGQFLPGTWLSTPQGKAGMSVWDPAANTAAINWMIAVGRAREFDAVKYYGC
jgi:soluble lytic murein transglycosylase-like protein